MSLYRATVVEPKGLGWASIRIARLYRDSIVGPVQCRVEVSPGDRVIVADLAAASKVHDWVVLAHESDIGRWFQPAPHEHPQGQVTGLVDRLVAIEARLDALEGGAV